MSVSKSIPPALEGWQLRLMLCRIITEVGPGVQRLAVGDRVALEPGVPCWSNKACREGRYNLCPDIKFFATPPHHGSLMQVGLTSSESFAGLFSHKEAHLQAVRRNRDTTYISS